MPCPTAAGLFRRRRGLPFVHDDLDVPVAVRGARDDLFEGVAEVAGLEGLVNDALGEVGLAVDELWGRERVSERQKGGEKWQTDLMKPEHRAEEEERLVTMLMPLEQFEEGAVLELGAEGEARASGSMRCCERASAACVGWTRGKMQRPRYPFPTSQFLQPSFPLRPNSSGSPQ
jgi:hypothetical protein